MRVCILGCGRMGAKIASLMDADGHEVTIIDKNRDSFNRLKNFRGLIKYGNGLEISFLKKIGLDRMDVFIATTNYDTRNILGANIAKEFFAVPKVIARFYDQERADVFRNYGIEAICVTSVGSEMIRELILEI